MNFVEKHYKSLYFDRSKKRRDGNFCICNESRPGTYRECIPETNPSSDQKHTFSEIINEVLCSIENKEDLEERKKLEVQWQVADIRLQPKLGK